MAIYTSEQKENLFNRIVKNYSPNNFVFERLKRAFTESYELFVPFVGSGLSQFAYKSWREVFSELVDQIVEANGDSMLLDQVREDIAAGNYFRAADCLEEIAPDLFYYSLSLECNDRKLDECEIPEGHVVRMMPTLFRNARVITTNHDEVLERVYARQNIYLRVAAPNDIRMFQQFMPRHLFKIYGSHDSNYEDLIFSSKAYDACYDKTSELYASVKNIIRSNILFFLGTGLRDDKTLDVIREVADEMTTNGRYFGKMHFAIVCADSDEDKQTRRNALSANKIFPIIYTAQDHIAEGFEEDPHAIVGILLEKLFDELVRTGKSAPIETKAPAVPAAPEEKPEEPEAKQESAAKARKTSFKQFAEELTRGNIEQAEALVPQLEKTLPFDLFIKRVISPLCSQGSTVAADKLYDYINSEDHSLSLSPSDTLDIIGAIVSYCNREDKEEEFFETVNSIVDGIEGELTPKEKANLCNQYARLYFGAFGSSGGSMQDYLDLAAKYITSATELDQNDPSYFYNAAIIYRRKREPDMAARMIDHCVNTLNSNDEDHITFALDVFEEVGDSKAIATLKDRFR